MYLLHREENPVVPVEEVLHFAEAVNQAGKECRVLVCPKTPERDAQKISLDEILPVADSWVDAQMNAL